MPPQAPRLRSSWKRTVAGAPSMVAGCCSAASLEQSDLAELARSVLQSVSGGGFHQALVERVFEDEAAQRRDDLTLMLLEVPADG